MRAPITGSAEGDRWLTGLPMVPLPGRDSFRRFERALLDAFEAMPAASSLRPGPASNDDYRATVAAWLDAQYGDLAEAREDGAGAAVALAAVSIAGCAAMIAFPPAAIPFGVAQALMALGGVRGWQLRQERRRQVAAIRTAPAEARYRIAAG